MSHVHDNKKYNINHVAFIIRINDLFNHLSSHDVMSSFRHRLPAAHRAVVAITVLVLIPSIIVAHLHYSLPPDYQQSLYPRESESRETRSLDGLWRFARGDPLQVDGGCENRWFNADLRSIDAAVVERMPVPASYNDIGTEAALRDHVGCVWYERSFTVVQDVVRGQKLVWLRFGGVNGAAVVWVNGKEAARHPIELGHLPFQVDITDLVALGEENRLTVMCDNRLDHRPAET